MSDDRKKNKQAAWKANFPDKKIENFKLDLEYSPPVVVKSEWNELIDHMSWLKNIKNIDGFAV